MNDGFVRVAAVTPELAVADPVFNADRIIAYAKEAAEAGAKIIVFPELAVTGSTCGDLFFQKKFLDRAYDELMRIVSLTADIDAVLFVGTPWQHKGKLYNAVAVISDGEILGIVPKMNLKDDAGTAGRRYFTPGFKETEFCDVTYEEFEDPEEEEAEDADDDFDDDDDDDYDDGTYEDTVSVGSQIIFVCEDYPALKIAAEVGEDLAAPKSPAADLAMAGATVIVNGAAAGETVGAAKHRLDTAAVKSGILHAAYIYASAGICESTTDMVFPGHSFIAANGKIIAEGERFKNGITYATIDVDLLASERQRDSLFVPYAGEEPEEMEFSVEIEETEQIPDYPVNPFIPDDETKLSERCEEILSIQAIGLKQRLEHINSRKVVLGLSGGLDSTLALLVCRRAFDYMGADPAGITAVTMPCFGTTDRTYNNAVQMAKAVGADLREVSIKDAVRVHFKDIGQPEDLHDVTYENAQARERTQVLMDIANQTGGLVVGTGDLSEMALGWCTYNGDHMSMYGVNGDVPKTLIRHVVAHAADTCGNEKLAQALRDVLDTPVSPELLPPEEGVISQKTEEIVGPYELHDFFLYYFLRYGFPPEKIYRIACEVFDGEYDPETILKWLKKFFWRFFSQQYKRSCSPDGPKVGSVGLSPRGGLVMPSDASVRVWIDALEKL